MERFRVSEVPGVLSDRLMREDVIIAVERTQRSGGCVELRADVFLARSICFAICQERRVHLQAGLTTALWRFSEW